MTKVFLVLVLLTPTGEQTKFEYLQPNLSVCQLELSKAYRYRVNRDETFVIYCKEHK